MKILCAGCDARIPEPKDEWEMPALCPKHCSVGHLDGSIRPAVAYLDGAPICESCARGLAAMGHDVQPSLAMGHAIEALEAK